MTGAPDIVLAVIDSGVDIDHEDLAANIWTNPGEIPGDGIDNDNNGFIDDVNGWDFIDGDNDPRDPDVNSHGTHVSGIAGAVGNNGIGVSGVAQQIQIMPIRAIGGPTAGVVEAINYAVANGAPISNNSWGATGVFIQSIFDAIEAAQAEDHLFVSSAGNDALDTDITDHTPSSFDLTNIIAVAASNDDDVFDTSYSNWGPTSVDLFAPGTNVFSTFENNRYGTNTGTSMASPVVAGAAAILRSLSPTSSAEQIKDILLSSVDVQPSMIGQVVSDGRLNLDRAIAQVSGIQLGVFPESIREDAGANAATGVVRRFGDLSNALSVTVVSSDTTEATVPSIVTIPAGSSRAFFAINAVDDTILDGTQTVGITASTGFGSPETTQFIDVTDVESLTLTIDRAEILSLIHI